MCVCVCACIHVCAMMSLRSCVYICVCAYIHMPERLPQQGLQAYPYSHARAYTRVQKTPYTSLCGAYCVCNVSANFFNATSMHAPYSSCDHCLLLSAVRLHFSCLEHRHISACLLRCMSTAATFCCCCFNSYYNISNNEQNLHDYP